MLDEMETWGVERGATHVEMTVMHENVQARSMYERRGYAFIAEDSCVLYGTTEIVRQDYLSKQLPTGVVLRNYCSPRE